MHKLGKRKASDVDFWRFFMIFGVPRETPKCTKMEKIPSKNRSKKSMQKRRRARPSVVRVGGHRAARRNARFLLRKVFALIFDNWFTHATTPGGVRRIPTGRAMAADPHHGLSGSPPFLPPFFQWIPGRHFFHLCSFLVSPGDPKNHEKSVKVGVGKSPFAELILFLDF